MKNAETNPPRRVKTLFTSSFFILHSSFAFA
jgi:hypothetical protein